MLRHTAVFILVLTTTLAFAGRILIVNNSHLEIDDLGFSNFSFKFNTGVLFLRNMKFYWHYRKRSSASHAPNASQHANHPADRDSGSTTNNFVSSSLGNPSTHSL